MHASIRIAYGSPMVGRGRTPELRHLVALAAIGRLGSFSAAAEELGYTQSAVSQQVARLERAVGHVLVDRPGGPRAVALTPAGTILLAHAEAITARLESAYADLAALRRGAVGVLRVGVFQSVGVRILPRLLGRFREEWPQVAVELTEAGDDTELFGGVERGELDLAFVVHPLVSGPFAGVELLADPYVVVLPAGDPLAETSGPLQVRALDGRPVVTFAPMRAVHAIEHRLGRPELAEQVVFRSHDSGTILELARAGVGAAVMTELSAATPVTRQGLTLRLLAGVEPRVVGLVWHRDRFRIAAQDAFVVLAEEVARQVAGPDPGEP